ncbi:MAG: hypothetical protein BMS9Abin33_0498 [Gammaproteobacteria bacterium]|nr:MAG: hypothetical protein BMS9Abin33_0498 [Gammaproteobacteria bacterium]
MAKSNKLTPLAAALGFTVVTSLAALPLANAAENPFTMKDIGSGYKVAKEGSCGGDKKMKGKEGSCGGDKKAKGKEGKCGGDKKMKGKEGNCGEGNKGMKDKKGKEGQCGEGKCGSNKKK